MRWWVIITTIMMLALGWGKNFMPLTEFFLDYFPDITSLEQYLLL